MVPHLLHVIGSPDMQQEESVRVHPVVNEFCADVRAGWTTGGHVLPGNTLHNALYTTDLRGRPRRITEPPS